jgi:hypothetical protein
MQQRNCPECGKPLTWIPQYQRWYCKKDKIYPELPLCPLCKQPLNWIPQYKRWYCYNDQQYPSLSQPVSKETISKETVREVVLIPCAYCSGLMPQTSTFCPNCGARRKG